MRTYEICPFNSFRMRTYKKTGGGTIRSFPWDAVYQENCLQKSRERRLKSVLLKKQCKRLGERLENYDGLIGARHYRFGDGDQLLLAENAEARRFGFAAV